MQAIAREFNLSETTFPVRPTAAGADYLLRIFTPTNELPFAGHPSVGTAWLMAQRGRVAPGRVVQECGAGLLPVEVDDDGATLTGGEPQIGASLEPEPLLAAVGLAGDDDDPSGAPRLVGTGRQQVRGPVRRAAPARAGGAAARIAAAQPCGMSVVFGWGGEARGASARMLAPGPGAVED